MIRLIDVDKLEHEYEQFNYYLTYSDCLEELRKAPLVNAIPVEWIQHYIKEHSMYGAIDDVFVIIHTMLCDWEKENETNRCRQD